MRTYPWHGIRDAKLTTAAVARSARLVRAESARLDRMLHGTPMDEACAACGNVPRHGLDAVTTDANGRLVHVQCLGARD